MTEQQINELPDHLKTQLAQYGFKVLEKKLRNTSSFHISKPKLTALWHEVMEHCEKEQE